MKLSGNKNSSVLLLIILIAALLFALYYYVVLPKKDDVESLESSVDSLQSEISSLQEQITTIEEDKNQIVTNVFELRKKVPQSRGIDQILLNMEELEYITDSRILSVSFNNYDSLVSESNLVPSPEETEEAAPTEGEVATEEGEGEPAGEEGGPAEGEEASEPPVSTISLDSLPPELKLITFNVEIESSTYENLQRFIKEIENLERVMRIDTIAYSLPGEEQLFDEEATDVVSASVQITTFYYEGE